MTIQPVNCTLLRAALGLAVLLAPAAAARADLSIPPGFDFFETTEGTEFLGIPFRGEPLGTAFGETDTIVERLGAAAVGAGGETAAPIPIEMVALQLVSIEPVDLGFGTDFHFITLQSERGGPASTGTMTITFNDDHVTAPEAPGGTGSFDSTIDVAFDVRMGGVDGPIIMSDTLPLVSTASSWDHVPGPDDLTIDGINHLLNGSTEHNDFFPRLVIEAHPAGKLAEHHAKPAGHAVTTDNPGLPPDTGVYRTAEEVHALFGDDAEALKMILKNPRHRPAPHPANEVTIDGDDEIEIFFTQLSGTVDVFKVPGIELQEPLLDAPLRAEGFVRVRSFGKAGQQTGTFETEMEMINLTGFVDTPLGPVPVMIQDLVQFDPEAASRGETTIRQLDDGRFAIDSFFDVWTVAGAAGSNLFNSDGPIRVRLGTPVPGDNDGDGDVDNSDLGSSLGNFNGPNPLPTAPHKFIDDGDVDGDLDVDNSDLGASFGGFTGPLNVLEGAGHTTDHSGHADLIYDWTDGNVTLDATEAAGAKITNFVLKNGAGTFAAPGTSTFPFTSIFTTDLAGEISQTDGTAAGFTGEWDLGDIFPTGMDLSGLESYLTYAKYVGALGTGNPELDLRVVPEPGTMSLLAVAAVLVGCLWRRRRAA